jgi:hypothetical protein
VTTKTLTTRQAWTLIAEIYERNADQPFVALAADSDCFLAVGAAGFCAALYVLHGRGQITTAQFGSMMETVNRTLDEKCGLGSNYIYLAAYDGEGAALRCMLATLFALEPEA